MKIKLDSKRLSELRRACNLTQDELGAAIGQSGRTVRRMESVDSEIKLSFKEIHLLASALVKWPYDLWGELPDYQEVYSSKITGADHFARVVLHSTVKKIIFKHIPDDEDIEQAMLELDKIVKNKITYNLENVIKVRNLFRIVTSKNKIDKLEFIFYPWGYASPQFSNDQYKIEDVVWKSNITIIGHSPNRPEPKSKIKFTTDEGVIHKHPETDETIYSNMHYGVSHEDFESVILNSRNVVTFNKSLDEDDEVPFSEDNFDEKNLTNNEEIIKKEQKQKK